MKDASFIIHTDGGSRGNPGPAAIGVLIQLHDGQEGSQLQTIKAFGKTIGHTTNNVAEYTAVIEALSAVQEILKENNSVSSRSGTITSMAFYLDSLLVVSQINGVYKIKNSDLRMLLMRVHELLATLPPAMFYAVRREQNSDADALVNQALDAAS